MMELARLGWRPFFASVFEPHRTKGWIPARVVCEARQYYLAWGESGELEVRLPGRLRHAAFLRSELPAVGDWVAVAPLPGGEQGIVQALLPRQSVLSRRRQDEQIIAANLDTVFLVAGLDGNYNLRRLERYLTAASLSGAVPVVVLNKADLCPDLDERLAEVEQIAGGARVHAVSAALGTGLEALAQYLGPGQTAGLVGSSGAGKSTLVNILVGSQCQEVREVRRGDQKGRHTTTRRELVPVPGGGLLIDTPGMRELQLWGGEEGLADGFAEIEALAADCRFADCRHGPEAGCAVRQALGEGRVDGKRVESYLKLKQELAGLRQHHKRLVEQARRKKTDKRAQRKQERRSGRMRSRDED
jgi:ribosome biogenesis GTPase / thiamine phosphate phosphatase